MKAAAKSDREKKVSTGRKQHRSREKHMGAKCLGMEREKKVTMERKKHGSEIFKHRLRENNIDREKNIWTRNF